MDTEVQVNKQIDLETDDSKERKGIERQKIYK